MICRHCNKEIIKQPKSLLGTDWTHVHKKGKLIFCTNKNGLHLTGLDKYATPEDKEQIVKRLLKEIDDV